MKNIRKIIFAALAILLFCTLSISAIAHSGRTDSNGGHTNHSTGEYHYHHGYSAHDHYDMNGDGIKDCPYNFKDKTGENSGNSSSSSASSSQDIREKTSQSSGSTSTSGNYNAGYKAGYAKAEKDLEKEHAKELSQTRNTAVFWTLVACIAVGFTIGAILLNKKRKNQR